MFFNLFLIKGVEIFFVFRYLFSKFFREKVMKNMTEGNPLKLIILFMIPILFGNVFQQIYILSDLYILGHYLGLHALAVAGAMTPVFIMAMMTATGFTNGLSIITAQRFGANDIKSVRKSFAIGILLSFLFAFIVIAFLVLKMDSILKLMNVPQDIYIDAGRFMTILSYGLVATIFYNFLSGILRALGDSKTPLYFLIFSSLLNIFINITLIVKFNLDVTGVAYGTCLAQVISVVLCLFYMLVRFKILRVKIEDFKVSFVYLIEHLKLAFPMCVQFSIIGLGIIFIQSVCNQFGTDTIAAFSAATRIEQLTTMPLFSLGMALTTYVAQNFGARLIRRIRQGVLQCFLLSSGLSLILATIAFVWGRDLAGLFLNHPDEKVISQSVMYIQTTTLFYFFLAQIFIFRQALQGMGRAVIPLVSAIIELIMRWFAAFVLAAILGYKGICYAGPIAWVFAALFVMVCYVITIKRFKVSLFGPLNQKSVIKRSFKIRLK